MRTGTTSSTPCESRTSRGCRGHHHPAQPSRKGSKTAGQALATGATLRLHGPHGIARMPPLAETWQSWEGHRGTPEATWISLHRSLPYDGSRRAALQQSWVGQALAEGHPTSRQTAGEPPSTSPLRLEYDYRTDKASTLPTACESHPCGAFHTRRSKNVSSVLPHPAMLGKPTA
jgi:hypothetical protein